MKFFKKSNEVGTDVDTTSYTTWDMCMRIVVGRTLVLVLPCNPRVDYENLEKSENDTLYLSII